MIGSVRQGDYSTTYTSDTSYTAHSKGYRIGQGTKRVIVGCHGHAGFSYQYQPYWASAPGYHTRQLVDTGGYVVRGIDHSQINAWGDPGAMWAMDDNYSYLTSTFLMPTTKIAIQGWSMGGLTALNWALRNPTKVAGLLLWNPVTDLRFFRDNAAAYTPTYSIGGATGGAYTSEINTTYGATTTASGAQTIPNNVGSPVTVNVVNAKEFADATTLGGGTTPQATFGGVNFTYTGKTGTALTGCLSTTGSSISVTNGGTISTTYALQSDNYNAWARASAYTTGNGITFPIKIVQATDDTTVAPAMNNDATNGFVARTGNSNVTQWSPQPTGGHSNAISNITPAAVQAFFDGLSW